jgi:lactate racemase
VKLSIPWGPTERLDFGLPEGWELLAEAAPAASPASDSLSDELRRALSEPLGCPPLVTRRLQDARVAIVAEDGTRPAPAAAMIDALLSELFRAGARSENIVLLPGLGVHRPMTADELAGKYGESADCLRVLQPDASSPGDYVELGEVAPGIPLELHREVCAADLVVLVGTVEPHIQAGFGGGAKMLVPGVASARCIAAMHVLGSPPKLVQLSGQGAEENPMRRAINAAPGKLSAEVFLFNVVLNPDLEVTAAFAGDVERAHAAASRRAAEIYGVSVPDTADVVISGSRPMDRDWRQGVKCFGGPLCAVRPGGVLIAAMRNFEGLGDYKPPFARALPPGLVRAIARFPGIRAVLRAFASSGRNLNPENLHMIFYALQMVRHCRVIVFSPTISCEEAALLPLFDFASSMEEALELAAEHVGGKPPVRLTVFPNGSISYPVFPPGAEADK